MPEDEKQTDSKDSTAENDDKAPAPSPASSASDWVSARKELREAAKWLATILAGVGGAVFAGGPIIARTDLDYSNDLLRAGLAVAFAALGAAAIVATIGILVNVVAPTRVSLDKLPPKLAKDVKERPGWYLPGNAETIDQMLAWLDAYRGIAVQLEHKIRHAKPEERSALEIQLVGVSANVLKIESERDELLELAAFETVEQQFSGTRRFVALVAPVVAIAAAAAYMLAISGTESDPAAKESAAVAEIGLLRPIGVNGAVWWEALSLGDCTSGATADEIAVLITGGNGSTADPYKVETLGDPVQSCDRQSLVVDPAVGAVVKPAASEIKVKLVEPKASK